jgi:hypothetical protein
MSLVSTSYYDEGTDEVIIRPNPDLNTLYRVDGNPTLLKNIEDPVSKRISPGTVSLSS